VPWHTALDPHHLAPVVDMDRFDRRTFAKEIADAPEVKDLLQQHSDRFGQDPAVSLDASLWAGLYKWIPKLAENAPAGLEAIHHAVKSAMELPQWAELRGHTQLDKWASALGLCSIGKKLAEAIPDDVAQDTKEAADEAARAEHLRNWSEAYKDAAGLTQSESLKQDLLQTSQELAEKSAEAARAAEAIGQRIQAKMDNLTPALHRAVRQGTEEALEAVNSTNQFFPGWGQELGSPTNTESSTRFALAQQMMGSTDLKKLAREVGRIKEMGLHCQKTRVVPRRSTKTDIELGRNLRDVLPSEYMYLADPDLEDVFVHKYAEAKLLQRRYKQKSERREGPIIMCVDTSGSMAWSGANIFAKATAIALLHIAARQKRAWACVLFGGKNEIKTFQFPDSAKAPPEKVLEVATFEYQGGTDFEAPLREALRIAEEAAFSKADIVFATDGLAHISDQALSAINNLKARKGLRTWGVAMPGCYPEGLKPFCDGVAEMQPGADEDAIKLIFGKV
jgi:uncharacterized protein with von Willebrand factor type A (vWA) domain